MSAFLAVMQDIIGRFGGQTAMPGVVVTEDNLRAAYQRGYNQGWNDEDVEGAQYSGAPAMVEAWKVGYADGQAELDRVHS